MTHREGRGLVQCDPPWPSGTLVGDMFDGEALFAVFYARAECWKVRECSWSVRRRSALDVASWPAAGVAELALFRPPTPDNENFGGALRAYYPALKIEVGSKDPLAFDVIVMRRRSA